jgi:glutamate-ammonia-ligase adenylyltransferase
VVNFRDPEAAQRVLDRIADLSSVDVAELVRRGLEGNSSPDLALNNLERWLRATSSPGLYAEQLAQRPNLGGLLLDLLGASQPTADILIQNPELSSLILEPRELDRSPTVDGVVLEGRKLLAASTSYTHSLDRLRFLRQRWYLTITLNDLGGRWKQEVVWRALSDLADALVILGSDLVWAEHRKLRDLPEVCPVMVVAFGKLGGQELNYSSDIDLAYVLEDGLDEKTERECSRFCESFGRAMSDRMGRGQLFRVDLRLRPYGAAGPILRSMSSFESYYVRYAEPWELQALLKTRAVAGPTSLADRWESMRVAHCFKQKLSEVALEEIFSMRARIEEFASADDIKRGAGGIRDVEFLVQALQLVHGGRKPELQVRNTLEVLGRLEDANLLEHSVVRSLESGYIFLRKLEHRVQLVGDTQTHEVPHNPEARAALAKTMGEKDWTELESRLNSHRRTIESLYRWTLHLEPESRDSRSRVAQEVGLLGSALLQWFDGLEERDAFYLGLQENQGSLERVRTILEYAPKMVDRFRQSLPLTEQLVSGEIEEFDDHLSRLARLKDATDLEGIARAYSGSVTKILTRWLLAPSTRPEVDITSLSELLLSRCLDWVAPDLTVVALGSFGNGEMSMESDMDLLLIAEDPTKQTEAELQAQRLLALFGKLRQYGAEVEVDLRLRPEGRKGLLVRTVQGLESYANSDLELWERFALGHSRLVRGSSQTMTTILEMAYGLSINGARLQELLEMKHRVETERVKPQHLLRNVKLGNGGLNDVEWLVHLNEMKYPIATDAKGGGPFSERIRNLGRAQLLNSLESEFLVSAHFHLLDVRLRLQLLGYEGDLVPENPDKLDRLAKSVGDADGNEFLARHEPVIDGVRRLYHESLERLLK